MKLQSKFLFPLSSRIRVTIHFCDGWVAGWVGGWLVKSDYTTHKGLPMGISTGTRVAKAVFRNATWFKTKLNIFGDKKNILRSSSKIKFNIFFIVMSRNNKKNWYSIFNLFLTNIMKRFMEDENKEYQKVQIHLIINTTTSC